jgi:3-oxoacyl-[acyl-carrier-protein] synthase-1
MRRVIVTGMGIVSCIGNNKEAVLGSLREGISGIEFIPELKDLGLRCQIGGRVTGLQTHGIDKKHLRTMSDVAKYVAVSALDALRDAKLSRESLAGNARVGVVVGTGGGGHKEVPNIETLLLAHKSPARLGATGVVKVMNSTAALNLASWFGIRGRAYSVSSACSTGADSIGHAFELIRQGVLDVCIAGSGEEWGRVAWATGENCGAVVTNSNDSPKKACRPFDRARQGMVPAEGGGVVILEVLEHAEARGAPQYAEVAGYGSANDGSEMFEPNGRGLKLAMEEALSCAGLSRPFAIDYINAHGVGTLIGDPMEVRVIRDVFSQYPPLVSSTKPLSGHAQGGAGTLEAIFTILMLHHGFVAPTLNLEDIAPECEGVRHVQSLLEVPLKLAMSFNAGLGGANACLIFKNL